MPERITCIVALYDTWMVLVDTDLGEYELLVLGPHPSRHQRRSAIRWVFDILTEEGFEADITRIRDLFES